MIAGSKKQRIPVGFWRLVRSFRVIGRCSNYLCLWGLSNFAKLISLETFGCIKQPFFRNLLTLLNLHKLSSAAILSTAGNFILNSAFHLHADPEPASRTTYAVSTAETQLCWSSLKVSCWCLAKSNLSTQSDQPCCYVCHYRFLLALFLKCLRSTLAGLHFCSTESM